MSELKFCPKCGAKLKSGEAYCAYCGTNLINRREDKEIQTSMASEKKNESQISAPKKHAQYGTFGRRFIAWIIDVILIGVISSILAGIINLTFFGWALVSQLYNSTIVNFILGFLYFWLLESYNQGQTLGKMALKLRTVDEETLEVADERKYAINNILKPTPFLILDLIIGVISSSDEPEKNRYRIMQKLSNTVVIDER
jgi:uncharacterized RDD family membrane protein YckC